MRKLLFIAPLVCLTINTAQAARSATGDGAPGATLSCSADFKAKLQQQMVRVLKQKALSPAAAYLLPPGSEISEKNYTERVRLYTAKVSDRLSRAFDKFQETGDVEAVASSVLGNARKRTQVGVYSREENSKLGVRDAVQVPCNSDTCVDMAINVQQLDVVPMTSTQVLNTLLKYRLANTTDYDAKICQSGDCSSLNQFVPLSPSTKIDAEQGFVLQETILISFPTSVLFGNTLANKYLYMVAPIEACGSKTYVLISHLFPSAENAISESSLYAMLSEKEGKTMVFGDLQAYANHPSAGYFRKIFLGSASRATARQTLKDKYKNLTKSLGHIVNIDDEGLLIP